MESNVSFDWDDILNKLDQNVASKSYNQSVFPLATEEGNTVGLNVEDTLESAVSVSDSQIVGRKRRLSNQQNEETSRRKYKKFQHLPEDIAEFKRQNVNKMERERQGTLTQDIRSLQPFILKNIYIPDHDVDSKYSILKSSVYTIKQLFQEISTLRTLLGPENFTESDVAATMEFPTVLQKNSTENLPVGVEVPVSSRPNKVVDAQNNIARSTIDTAINPAVTVQSNETYNNSIEALNGVHSGAYSAPVKGFHNGAYSAPVNNSTYSAPVNNSTYSAPVNNGAYSAPVINSAYSAPVNNGAYSALVNNSTYSAPVNNSTYSAPVNNGVYRAQVNNSKYSAPVNNGTYSVPVNNGTYSAPVNNEVYSDPVNNGVLSAPVNNRIYIAPVNNVVYCDPVNNGIYSAPVNSGVYNAPVNNRVYSAPVNSGVYSAPVNHRVYSAPVNHRVYSAPVNNGVYSAPVNNGVYSAPVNNGVYSDPVNSGSYNVPVNGTTKGTEQSIKVIQNVGTTQISEQSTSDLDFLFPSIVTSSATELEKSTAMPKPSEETPTTSGTLFEDDSYMPSFLDLLN